MGSSSKYRNRSKPETMSILLAGIWGPEGPYSHIYTEPQISQMKSYNLLSWQGNISRIKVVLLFIQITPSETHCSSFSWDQPKWKYFILGVWTPVCPVQLTWSPPQPPFAQNDFILKEFPFPEWNCMGEVSTEAVLSDARGETNPPIFPQPSQGTLRKLKWDLDMKRPPCSSTKIAPPPAQSSSQKENQLPAFRDLGI